MNIQWIPALAFLFTAYNSIIQLALFQKSWHGSYWAHLLIIFLASSWLRLTPSSLKACMSSVASTRPSWFRSMSLKTSLSFFSWLFTYSVNSVNVTSPELSWSDRCRNLWKQIRIHHLLFIIYLLICMPLDTMEWIQIQKTHSWVAWSKCMIRDTRLHHRMQLDPSPSLSIRFTKAEVAYCILEILMELPGLELHKAQRVPWIIFKLLVQLPQI